MVGLGGLPIAHGDVEDFEGSPGADGVQWIGRKGVRGRCIVLIFLPGTLLSFHTLSEPPREWNGNRKIRSQRDERSIS